MVATYRPIRANIGRQRVPSTDTSSQADFERSVRQQINAVLDNFKGFVEHMENVTPEILYAALEPTFEQSQELVPVLSGALKASGYLETRRFRGNIVAEIGYGKGGYPAYAAFVHERTDVKHRAPTRSKFLQYPLEQNADAIQNAIVAGMREASGV